MISIIVPIYNAFDNLPHLIDSITKQTFQDWELILVDDGSKDESLSLCQRYANDDTRIKVIHQNNQGPSIARNTGIKVSMGEWITFVDADDDLLDCFLESMYNESQKALNIDIVFAGYLIVEANGNSVYTYESIVYSGKEDVRKAITQTNLLHRCCPWGKMFRRKIMLDYGILFDTKLAHSEDRLFFYDYLLHTRGIATTSVIGYLYDSTQIGTLKNQRLVPEKLKLRQKLLTEAAHRVMECFVLKEEEVFPIAKHLITLFATAIQGFYFAGGNRKQIIKLQQQFYNNYFDKKLYNEVKDSIKWKKFQSNNPMLQMVIHQEFCMVNNHLANINRKIAIYRIVCKLLRRIPQTRSFINAVNFLNKNVL